MLLSADPRMARRMSMVCRHSGHDFVAVEQASELRAALSHGQPDVLLLDATASAEETAQLALGIAKTHPALGIALATVGHEGRSLRGFRLINVRRPRDKVADELELTFIGIPASVQDIPA
ncbi:MAG TPA: hypothetical protein VGH93_12545 [Solirubrobacteraceae bacterium]